MMSAYENHSKGGIPTNFGGINEDEEPLADDDAEENHEAGGAADDGAQLFVVDHPQLTRVEWGLDFVATAAL